jgi:hypothetical protein
MRCSTDARHRHSRKFLNDSLPAWSMSEPCQRNGRAHRVHSRGKRTQARRRAATSIRRLELWNECGGAPAATPQSLGTATSMTTMKQTRECRHLEDDVQVLWRAVSGAQCRHSRHKLLAVDESVVVLRAGVATATERGHRSTALAHQATERCCTPTPACCRHEQRTSSKSLNTLRTLRKAFCATHAGKRCESGAETPARKPPPQRSRTSP